MPLLNLDCLLGLQLLPANSVDSIVTDPPYELTSARPGGRSPATEGAVMRGFMGMEWDGSGIAYNVALWREALRVLKPGGHLLSFGGSRTYHRMACAIEDAEFEIRDQIMWVYGSGFPKSRNISQLDQAGAEWDGWGTALKPAHEPICVARKPFPATVAANVLEWRTGALNIDGCRVHAHDSAGTAYSSARMMPGAGQNATGETHQAGAAFEGHTKAGRWPANFIHDGSAEVVALFPAQAGAAAPVRGTEPSAASLGRVTNLRARVATQFHGDTGSAARFFYCAKASQAERGEGNTHPTVKPIALIRHLQRLVTPPGGLTLDLFTGSGTAMVAAKLEGFEFLGFELQPEYCAIAERRAEAA